MVLKHILGFVLIASTLVAPAQRSFDPRVDPGPKPIAVMPEVSVVDAGDSLEVTVALDVESVSSTTVFLTSSNTAVVSVPPSFVVGRGNQAGCFEATTLVARQSLRRGTVVRITAATSFGSAYADVTVN
jgi:hypothetical protein